MIWDFHVGQKVVCINRGPWIEVDPTERPYPKPQYGEICTIAEMVSYECLYLGFEEYDPETVFGSEHFRPLRERKTDISIFTAMLNPVREGADA